MAILYAETLEGVQNDTAVSAVFLDICSTYDNVLVDNLIDKMTRLGIFSGMYRFVYNLVSAHQAWCRYDGGGFLVVQGTATGKGFELPTVLNIQVCS